MNNKLTLYINKSDVDSKKYMVKYRSDCSTDYNKTTIVPKIRQPYKENYDKWCSRHKHCLNNTFLLTQRFIDMYELENCKFSVSNQELFKKRLFGIIYQLEEH